TPAGRPLIRDLGLSLGHDRVALIGRNGAGKSSLLRVLAGEVEPAQGSVHASAEPVLVGQELRARELERARVALRERAMIDHAVARELAELDLARLLEPDLLAASRGQARKLALLAAKCSGSPLLLLDEPTEDLDEAGITWLQ